MPLEAWEQSLPCLLSPVLSCSSTWSHDRNESLATLMRNESFPYEPEETSICCVLDTMFCDLSSTLCSQHNLPHPSHNTPGPSLPNPNCSTRDRQDPWTNIWHLAAVSCHFWPCVPEGREAQSSLRRFSSAPRCSQPAWGWGEDRAQWPALKSG